MTLLIRGRVYTKSADRRSTLVALTILAGQAIASLAGGATGPSPLMSVGAILMATMGLVALATLGRLTGERPPAPEPGLEVTEG